MIPIENTVSKILAIFFIITLLNYIPIIGNRPSKHITDNR